MTISTIRYSFGGDEHLFVEVSEEMSLDSFYKVMAMTNAIKQKNIHGVTELCPANASFQIRFDPDVIAPDALLAIIKEIDNQTQNQSLITETRIIEIPVLYDDPWTNETQSRFRDRHQEPDSTDLKYAAKINGYESVAKFIEAHSGTPWFVSMIGFVAGLPFMYQMVERGKQIQVPKYVRPRTDTPKLTIGHGGCFSCIYSVRGAGGYQMFGVTPAPIFDAEQKLPYLKEFMCFFKPGDIVKFKSITRAEYDKAVEQVEQGVFDLKIKAVQFSMSDFKKNEDATNQKLVEVLYGD